MQFFRPLIFFVNHADFINDITICLVCLYYFVNIIATDNVAC